jgi:hypothetical protein
VSVSIGSPELRGRNGFGIHIVRMSLKSAIRIATAIVRILACLASIAMLLTFPIIKPHIFSDHYRTPEIRRSIVRNTHVAEAKNATVETVARIGIQPNALSFLRDLDTKFKSSINVESVPQVTPIRLFLRLKSRTPPAGGEDPLV